MTRHASVALAEATSFGDRYKLLRRLAVGGMAEIFLARQDAMAGFEKEVVIKRLRAELAGDARIVEMFLDEARIGALLNHPNIVHVYDVDEHEGVPYIAMEYIVGEELNELCRRGLAHGKFLPLEHAVELIRQAAAGMGYFHAKRGGEGSALATRPLDIVHCDISPSNLLVTEDGFLKLIDFGIAKSAFQRDRAEGVIPGKLSYMSPEQASRKPVDHRSDIFSLGIVLYEITVGRRLFKGSAQEVIRRLVECEVEPPTFSRRDFPPALEAIVLRTLERHPDDRYQTAYDLADDLEAFLRDMRMHSGPVRIARYLDHLAEAGGGSRRRELISEAEQRRGDEDLDFDSQVFEGYAPASGDAGAGRAPEWSDVEEPEAEVAAALGLDLAELRSLRTPVPLRGLPLPAPRDSQPALAALAPADGREAAPASAREAPAPASDRAPTEPEPATSTRPGGPPPGAAGGGAGGGDPVDDAYDDTYDADDADTPVRAVDPVGRGAAPAGAAAQRPAGAAGAAGAVEVAGPRAGASSSSSSLSSSSSSSSAVRAAGPAADAVGNPAGAGAAGGPGGEPAPYPERRRGERRQAAPAPTIGASYLARSEASRLPWMLVAGLGVAVVSLLAYIVLS